MREKNRGFYIFCALTACLILIAVWAGVSLFEAGDNSTAESHDSTADEMAALQALNIPPARQVLDPEYRAEKPQAAALKQKMDDSLLQESLDEGATSTQTVGEKGSLEGVITTDYPMVYTESKYERLPNSPLFIFTDDMIWKDGEDSFQARRDALVDQSKHIQEASVALSVSPRVVREKTTGYRLVEIPEHTLFAQMGMVSGDIIVSINGKMPDMEPMALMFVNMAAGKHGASTIVVDHRGTERTIHLRAVE